MDTSGKNISIELANQERNPATIRFLDSLGFGETVLQDLRDSDQEGGSPSSDDSEEEKNPAVMLSSQVDGLDLPGVDAFSEITHTRRGGLQDIVRRQSDDSRTAAPVEKLRVSTLPGDESFPNVVQGKEEIKEGVEKKTESTGPEIADLKNVVTEEIPFPEAILQRAPSQISSVIVNGKEIRGNETTNKDAPEKVIVEAVIQEEPEFADIAIVSDERIEVGSEELIGEENFTDNESAEPVILSCPECEGELTLQKEHLGVEGNCVWCGIAIVAAESGADGKIRVFAIESKVSPQEVIVFEEEISNSFDQEEQAPEIEEETPIADNFSPLSKGTGFADLPSAPASFEKDAVIVGTAAPSEIPVNSAWGELSSPKEEPPELETKEREVAFSASLEPLPELPSASTFDQLGKDAAWADPFPESHQVDDSAHEKFPFLEKKSTSGVNKDETRGAESPPSGEDTVKPVESPKELSSVSEPFPKNEESSSPFPDTESSSKLAKLSYDAKLKIPDDVLSFLGSIEPAEEESPEDLQTDEAKADDTESISEPAVEQEEKIVEEIPPLSKKDLKKEGRAKKKEASLKKNSEHPGPLPALGSVSAKSGSKMTGKTKAGIISIAVLVAGIGVVSFLVPVQEYVDKAHIFMSEAFDEPIGL